MSTRFDHKLNKLEYLINYNIGKKGTGWTEEEGPKRFILHEVENFVLEC